MAQHKVRVAQQWREERNEERNEKRRLSHQPTANSDATARGVSSTDQLPSRQPMSAGRISAGSVLHALVLSRQFPWTEHRMSTASVSVSAGRGGTDLVLPKLALPCPNLPCLT